MPKTLAQYLTGLTVAQAEELFTWLDGNRDTISDMQGMIVRQNGAAMYRSGFLSRETAKARREV